MAMVLIAIAFSIGFVLMAQKLIEFSTVLFISDNILIDCFVVPRDSGLIFQSICYLLWTPILSQASINRLLDRFGQLD